jgi:ribosome-binding factor A
MPSVERIRKINEEIAKELSDIMSGLKDPRLAGIVSVTHVSASRDLSFADVYVSFMNSNVPGKDIKAALASASGHVRSELASRMGLRKTPSLRFYLDDSLTEGAKILGKLNELGISE